jgi:predicted nucleotidyltransferase/DNA-binding transcriptional regulator YiaG
MWVLSTPMKHKMLTTTSMRYTIYMEVNDMNQLLKAVRDNLSLTQIEISNLLGIPVNTIRNWEQEIRTPSEWVLDLLIDRIFREMNEQHTVVDEETGLLSFLTIKKGVTKIAEKYNIKRIYLFGSYVKGQATPHSDIDLYMEADLYGLEYFEFVEQLRGNLKKKVEVLSNKTIQEQSKIDEEIKKTGVLIYER